MRSLEIFSGAGGLAKGLELAGLNHAAFVEFNKHACKSLKANFNKDLVFCGDIKDFDLSSLSGIEVVAGGPPCQPFSLGGKHRANHDSRDMFPYAIRAIEALTPKVFIFENVKGLLRPSFSEYFSYIILRLTFPDFKAKAGMDWMEHLQELRRIEYASYQSMKYIISYKLINSADFGVPQCRERLVIVGVHSDIDKPFVFPAPTHSKDCLVWDKYVTGAYWRRHNIPKPQHDSLPSSTVSPKITQLRDFGVDTSVLKPWVTIRDLLSEIPDPKEKHNIPDHIFRDGARTYPGHTGSDIDWPAKALKAGVHGVPGGENMIRFSDGSVRYFTVFEAKKIQTFPEDFVIHGSWTEAMRQIGNAVPVSLAEKIGISIRKTITG